MMKPLLLLYVARVLPVTQGNEKSDHIVTIYQGIALLMAENRCAVDSHDYDYAVGTLYIDLVSELEKLGDYVVNVVEARLGK